MPPQSSSFRSLNYSHSLPSQMDTFTLSAPTNTHLWRDPLSGNICTATIIYTALQSPFIRAEVTVNTLLEHEGDQCGLVIFAGPLPGTIPNPNPPPAPSPSASICTTTTTQSTTEPQPQLLLPRSETPTPYIQPLLDPTWVKAGPKFSNNKCHFSSVCATSDGADQVLDPFAYSQDTDSLSTYKLSVKLERIGNALWIWFSKDSNGSWTKHRAMNWFFWGVETKAVRVGIYVSRPKNFEGEGVGAALTVEFDGLDII